MDDEESKDIWSQINFSWIRYPGTWKRYPSHAGSGQPSRRYRRVLQVTTIQSYHDSDAFYLQYFDAAFPDLDFSELQAGDTEELVGENIQALIDLLSEQIMRADLSHISGIEIACGNPDHCLELLQIIHQLTVVMAEQDDT